MNFALQALLLGAVDGIVGVGGWPWSVARDGRGKKGGEGVRLQSSLRRILRFIEKMVSCMSCCWVAIVKGESERQPAAWWVGEGGEVRSRKGSQWVTMEGRPRVAVE